jgi:hypothetical protein
MLNATKAGINTDDPGESSSDVHEEDIMDHRTRGFVIALASLAVGGLLPAAVSAQMAGTYLMAAGMGAVVLLNAAIAFIHINEAADPDRTPATKTDGKATAPHALRTVSSTPAG